MGKIKVFGTEYDLLEILRIIKAFGRALGIEKQICDKLDVVVADTTTPIDDQVLKYIQKWWKSI